MATPATPDVITWLHFSDLHAGCRGEPILHQLVEELERDVRAMLRPVGPPDLILFTGDLANKGTEYERVNAFLDRVRGWLAVPGHPEPLLFAVPGNHDLVRPSGRHKLTYRVLRDLDARDADAQEVWRELWEQRDASLIAPLFEPYSAWMAEHVVAPLAGDPRCTVHTSFFPGDLSAVITKGALRLGLVGLNSAWVQYAGGDFEKLLQLPAAQLHAALPGPDGLATSERKPGHNPLDFFKCVSHAFLLMHHPPSWLSPAARKEFESHVYPTADRFALCLFGHVHAARSEVTAVSGTAPRAYFQAPSMFGIESYGTQHEQRAFGYGWGRLTGNGELRVWPRVLVERASGRLAFDRDQRFDAREDGSVVLREGKPDASPAARPDGNNVRLPDTTSTAGTAGATATIDTAAQNRAVAAYLAWARDAYSRLDMVGLGGGALRLTLDDIFVPLRFHARDHAGDEPRHGKELYRFRHTAHPVELLDAFTHAGPDRELFVLGDPGAGKTTALKKLLWAIVRDELDGSRAGLPAPTLPVFLLVRSLTAALREQPLSALLRAELTRQAPELIASHPDLADQLWTRGHLLLLLDGLDEVADPAQRRAICHYLEAELARARDQGGTRGIRAVVASRFSGVSADVNLGARFVRLDVHPLDDDQMAQLIERWFTAAECALAAVHESDLDAARRVATERARALADQLGAGEYRSQRIKSLVANPMLLTLLCVVVFNGGEVPRRRVEFFSACLRTLLGRWARLKNPAPLLDAEDALAVLRPVAWKLHTERRKYDLGESELRALVCPVLEQLEARLGPLSPTEILRWLIETAGVLTRYATRDDGTPEYGFMHLSLQEYLAASSAAYEGQLATVVEHFGDEWWQEVTLLYAALPGQPTFAPLARALLAPPRAGAEDPLFAHDSLFRMCIAEAHAPDTGPFIELALDRSADSRRREQALQLIADHVDRRLLRAVAEVALEAQPGSTLRAVAERVEATRRVPRPAVRVPDTKPEGPAGSAGETAGAVEAATVERTAEYAFDVFVSYSSADKPAVHALADTLKARGVRVWLDEWELVPGQSWQDALERAIAGSRTAAVMVGPSGQGPWHALETRAALSEFVRRGMPVIPVLLPGAPGQPDPGELPLFLREFTWVDLRAGADERDVDRLVWGVTGQKPGQRPEGTPTARGPGPGAARIVPGQMFVEPRIGLRMLWIPGGEFRMGSDDRDREAFDGEKPAHRVVVSPYWLAETPVTNRQYRAFLEATDHDEPPSWRDRRYNQDEQPVVAVSWHDAVAYCAWLTKVSDLGVAYGLPTEAAWEFAARGTDGRLYPWGNEPPDDDRAYFDKAGENDGPLPVGSKPLGGGPFGTLDQAGNVWEWCKDVWNRDAYAQRVKEYGQRAAPDPEVVEGDEDRRACRGGSFAGRAGYLRAASRHGYDAAAGSGDLGFRLSARPASPLLDS